MTKNNRHLNNHRGDDGLPKRLDIDANPADTRNGQPPAAIYYYCPEIQTASAGIRRLHRHVAILNSAGFPAFILHEKKGFRYPDAPRAPIICMEDITPCKHAIFVIPEGMPRVMYQLKDYPGRRFVIALSWDYIFRTLPDGLDWRQMKIERVLAVSPMIGELVSWSMGLPVHLIGSSIDFRHYYFAPVEKQAQIAYILRKALNIEKLKSLLSARNPEFTTKIRWVGLEALSQEQYAAEIRRSAFFLTLSPAEGFPTCALEAMAAGTVVAGYHGSGGKGILQGDGVNQNCILAAGGDYPALAYQLAPFLNDLIQFRMDRLKSIIKKGMQVACAYTDDSEARTLIDFWNRFAGRAARGVTSSPAFDPAPLSARGSECDLEYNRQQDVAVFRNPRMKQE